MGEHPWLLKHTFNKKMVLILSQKSTKTHSLNPTYHKLGTVPTEECVSLYILVCLHIVIQRLRKLLYFPDTYTIWRL